MAEQTSARRAAVVGSPIAHSLSPVLHRAAYSALGLTGWRYDAVDCTEAALAGLVAGLGPDWAGLSVTMPLKRAALALADEASPLSRAVGAANTLLPGERLRAENTDVAGLLGALRAAGLADATRAVVLGAGGTAQAALAALRELGCGEPVVLVRDLSRTHDLRATAERLGVRPDLRAGLDRPLPPVDVVISTLPAGAADALPAPSDAAVVLDVVYAPWPTVYARAAGAAGCRIASGLEVLLHQAVEQVLLMTGRPAPVAAMRAALDAAVRAGPGRAV